MQTIDNEFMPRLRPQRDAVLRSDSAQRVFGLIVAFRWLSLLPALVLLFARRPASDSALWVWLVAVAANGVLAAFTGRLNDAVRRRPVLLGLDLLLMAILVAVSGGWESPYFLYALNPLIVAAHFFGLTGALRAAIAFLPLYAAAVLGAAAWSATPVNWLLFVTQLSGILLLSIGFGYAGSVVARLRETQTALIEARDTLARQAVVDKASAEQRLTRQRQAAVDAERMRIARDMHDSVSQALFGLAYMLDGCRKLLPDRPEAARDELAALIPVAEGIRTDVRHIIFDIWPDELTAERFSADLNQYFTALNCSPPVALDLDIRGAFQPLSPTSRRQLYRICQESLANVARHASADNVRVCLDVDRARARLVVRDDGAGFNCTGIAAAPRVAAAAQPHFGLRGMAERARTLGGTFDVFSRPGAGTTVVVDIPVDAPSEAVDDLD